jgi:hypothetical protein
MVRVPENDLRAHLDQLARIQGLHAPCVPTGINTGVSMTPCFVVSRPAARGCARPSLELEHRLTYAPAVLDPHPVRYPVGPRVTK